jgi:hypothetical protein
MLHKRLAAAQAFLPALREAEASHDLALEHSALLVAALVAASRDGGLAMEVAQEAMDGVGAHLSVMLEGRRKLVRAHAQLAELRDRTGLRTRLSGGLGDKPDEINPATVTPLAA